MKSPSPTPTTSINKTRKVLFSAIILCLVWLSLDLLARGFGVSPVVMDPFVLDRGAQRYVPNKDAFLPMQPWSFSAAKPQGTFRIFIFGGSTVYYNKHFGPLKKWLSAAYPHQRIEIINMGIEAYGSDRVLLLARAALRHQPDLFIIYSGNNEFLQPPDGRTPAQGEAGSGLLHSVRDAMLRCRAGVLLARIFQRASKALGKESSIIPPRNMPAFSWHTPFSPRQKEAVYRDYDDNIRKVVQLCKDHSVKCIVSTVAYNYISDRYLDPKYYSIHYPHTRYNKGQVSIQSLKQEDLEKLAAAAKTSPYIANRLARRHMERGEHQAAKELFIQAAQQDLQPFRANIRTNSIIRRISAEQGVPLADVDRAMESAALYGIPGYDLFWDYCHPNKAGNRIMQKTFFEVIQKNRLLR